MKAMNPKDMISWLGAFGCSCVFHVVVVVFFVCTGGSSSGNDDPAVTGAAVAPVENPAEPGAGVNAAEPETPPAELDPVGLPTPGANRSGNRTPSAANPAGRASARSATRANARPRAPAPASAGDAPVKTKSYTVKPGDNLTHLARKCGSTPEEIAKINGVDVKKMADLKVGQTIKIKDND